MKVLVIASHPDDEVLGCGGTIAKHSQNGDEVGILILSQGRIKNQSQILNASQELEATLLDVVDFKAQHFEMMPQSEIADLIVKHLREFKPDIVYTHSKNDLNKDHQVTYEATLVATRPNHTYSPKAVYAYEVHGSNLQYRKQTNFNPTHFVNIFNTIEYKLRAMDSYKDELNEYPHPRSKEGIVIYAEFRGLQCDYQYAEAFETIRTIVE